LVAVEKGIAKAGKLFAKADAALHKAETAFEEYRERSSSEAVGLGKVTKAERPGKIAELAAKDPIKAAVAGGSVDMADRFAPVPTGLAPMGGAAALSARAAGGTGGKGLGVEGSSSSAGAHRSVGARARLGYEPAPYHSQMDNAVKSRAPIHGQRALDSSIQVKSTSPRRVGIDPETNEIVVFDQTIGNTFHGHVRSWEMLHQDMKNALVKGGLVDKNGKIL
jgi:hypothetical protein